MFGILGISFLKDEMGYCSGPEDYYGINQTRCNQLGHEWKTWPWNFDNIGSAFVTLFVLSSLEGWPDVMATVFDANTASNGPTYNNTKIFGMIYFIFFVLIGALFLMNLFVGVIFLQFSEEQKKEKNQKYPLVTENQMKWIQMQELIATSKPEFDLTAPPEHPLRLNVFK